ncbi:hypothetical protein WME99_03025 [Sorangium sp. So ce136]|uniref:hypothetical protein n=1 Tax=Sorangium sp. So ce136 TaxID=3133284 RepID=UPI003EFDDEEC
MGSSSTPLPARADSYPTQQQRPGAWSAGAGDVASGAAPLPRDARRRGSPALATRAARLARAGGELDLLGLTIGGRPRARGGCTS